MLIRHKKSFLKGIILVGSFFIMAAIMLTPIFKGYDGEKLTSLEYADTVFNALSKGSSNFIEEVKENVKKVADQNVDLNISFNNLALSRLAQLELIKAGIKNARDIDGVVSFHGLLGPILFSATKDAADLFANNGQVVSERYEGANPLEVSRAWWFLLEPAVKELQKAGRISDAQAVDMVIKKAIEPANNFYGISDANVADNILLIFGMLTFYVLYAIWYGFGIYNLFDGIGLLGHSEKPVEDVKE